MSNVNYDDAPPMRKSPTHVRMRGRISTAYVEDVPTLSLQEPTPEMDQDEFSPPPSGQYAYASVLAGPSTSTRKGKEPIRPSPTYESPRSGNSPRPSTPEDPFVSSNGSTPRQQPTRRTSVPIKRMSVNLPTVPRDCRVICENCRSVHNVSISDSDRVTVNNCDKTPPSPVPSPTVLEMYHLPGHLSLNDSGQILVKSEAELLSYVRKIFAIKFPYKGYFPRERRYYINKNTDEEMDYSQTSTPEDKRASFYLGHSDYLGTTHQVKEDSEDTSKDVSKSQTTNSSPDDSDDDNDDDESKDEDQSSPPPVKRDTKPAGYVHSRSRSHSPNPTIMTIVPRRSRSSSGPQHASAARRESPRNLRPIGISSEVSDDTDPPQYANLAHEMEATEIQDPRSRSTSSQRYRIEASTGTDSYSVSAQISRETYTETMPHSPEPRRYSPPYPSPSTRGRRPRMR